MSRASQRHSRQRAPGLSIAYDNAILADGPVAYWTFNGGSAGVADRTGHAHTGAYYNGHNVTDFIDGSLATVFDGVSQYIEVADDAALSVPASGILSFEVWMRPDVLEFPNSEDTGYVHWMGKGTTGQYEYAGRMYSFTNSEVPSRPNRISGYSFNLAGGLGAGSYFQDTVIPGEWIFFTFIINTVNTSGPYPTGYTKVYKNGELRDQDSLSEYSIVPGNGTAPFRVGTRDLQSFFQGALGKMAIYDYELSLATIRSHYELIVPPILGSATFVKNIGTSSSKSTGATLTVTVPAGGVSSGHTLIARVAHDYTSGGPTMSDNRGNTYTRDRTAANGGTTMRISIFSCPVSTPLQAGDTITVTLSASIDARAVSIDEFANMLHPLVIDTQDGASGSSTTPTLSVATTNADDLLISFVGVEGPVGDSYTEDTPHQWTGLMRAGTTGGAADTNVTVNSAYRAVGSTGTYTYEPTLGSTTNWIEFGIAYRAQ